MDSEFKLIHTNIWDEPMKFENHKGHRFEMSNEDWRAMGQPEVIKIEARKVWGVEDGSD